MDAAHINPTRKFPGSTLAELTDAVSQYEAGTHPLCKYPVDPTLVPRMKTEIANRHSGASKHFVVPQPIGRMTIKTI